MAVLSYSCVTRVTKQEAPASASIDRLARHCAREWWVSLTGTVGFAVLRALPAQPHPSAYSPARPPSKGLRSGLASDETEQRG